MATQHAGIKRLAAPLDKFIVDGFNFCEPDVHHYFLTHAHSDHTCGLRSSFDLGTIYCSALTARFLRATFGTKQKILQTFEPGDTIEVEGVAITAIDAGHCPGSLMFLFVHLTTGHRALHTGDCRASPDVVAAAVKAAKDAVAASTTEQTVSSSSAAASSSSSASSSVPIAPRGSLIDTIYLDTTYAQPRWTFPSQPASLEMLEAIVAAELAREPKTLFVVGSYQVGKEKAISSVARASGGRALVPSHRALSLRLCHAWDDGLHTEQPDAPDVRVHVSPMGAMGAEAHDQMHETLQKSSGRYEAVVMLRPTGWTYTKALSDGGAPKVWAENGGATRVYGVPYSEHSSYSELHALVSALRPGKVVPTVNAESAAERERLIGQFAKSMDIASSKRTLDWHFRLPSGPSATEERGPTAAAAANAIDVDDDEAGHVAAASAVCLDEIDIEHQQRLWSLLARDTVALDAAATPPTQHMSSATSATARSTEALRRAASATSSGGDTLGDEIASEAVDQLHELLGASVPTKYLHALLADAAGDVEHACAIHFGANGGVVPSALADSPLPHQTPTSGQGGRASSVAGGSATGGSVAGGSVAGGSATGGSVARVPSAGRESMDCAHADELALPPGTVAWVVGKEFKLYTSREALEARLQELGAVVVSSGGRHSKKEVTLIVVPEGTEAGSVVRGACPNAPIVHESWVVRRARALKAGIIQPAAAPSPPSKGGKKRAHSAAGAATAGSGASAAAAGGEKRAARFRSMSAAAAARMERAMTERLYLVDQRDASTTSPSGLVTRSHEFTVLGSTGNVYTVAISRTPSCTCVDFTDRSAICKHLLFVYVKVLRVPRDSHLPVQKGLLRHELVEILPPHAPTADDAGGASGADAAGGAHRASTVGTAAVDADETVLASPEVRRAFRRAAGTDDDETAATEGEPAEVPPRTGDDEPCAICFDQIEEEAPDEVLAEALASGPPANASCTAAACAADGPPTTHCGFGCGRVFHARCMVRWFEARGHHARRECPVCRSAWRAETESERRARADASGSVAGGDGDDELVAPSEGDAAFLNLGNLQPGVQRVRDASSYSSWLDFHQRRREQERLNRAAGGGE